MQLKLKWMPHPLSLYLRMQQKLIVSLLLLYCRDLLKRIPQARIKHCYREGNKCADRLARLGADMEENFVVFDAPPPVIAPLLILDKLGMTQERVCNEVVFPT